MIPSVIMNYKQKQFARWRLMQKLEHKSRSGSKEGFVKIFHNNTPKHELVKFQIAYKLKKLGYEVWSECEFGAGNSGRADLVAIKDGKGYIIEVLHSETEEKYLNKISSYPSEYELIKVKTDEFDFDTFEI